MAFIDSSEDIHRRGLAQGQRKEELINRGLENALRGLQSIEDQKIREEETARAEEARRRQEAMQNLQLSSQLSASGQVVTPEQVGQALQTGQFGGLQSVFQQQAEQVQAERQQKQRSGKLQERLTTAQIKVAEAKPGLEKQKAERDFQKEQRKATDSLRSEITKRKSYQRAEQVDVSLGKIRSSAKSKTPAGDMAMIFNYMKSLDPESTVREGEYASVRNTTGVPGQIINLYNQAVDGNLLNDKQRADILNQAESFGRSHYDAYLASISPELQTMSDRGLNQSQILPKFKFIGKGQPQQPSTLVSNGSPQQISIPSGLKPVKGLSEQSKQQIQQQSVNLVPIGREEMVVIDQYFSSKGVDPVGGIRTFAQDNGLTEEQAQRIILNRAIQQGQ